MVFGSDIWHNLQFTLVPKFSYSKVRVSDSRSGMCHTQHQIPDTGDGYATASIVLIHLVLRCWYWYVEPQKEARNSLLHELNGIISSILLPKQL